MTNIQPKATGEDLEAQGTVATKHFPSRMYAVYVHVSCIQHGQHERQRETEAAAEAARAASAESEPRGGSASSGRDVDLGDVDG